MRFRKRRLILTQRDKRSFTLLEICLCIVILTLVSGFLGLRIKESVEHQRFLSQVSGFTAELKRVQGFALSYRADFGIKVYKKEEKFYYKFFTDEPLDFIQKVPARSLKGFTALSLNRKDESEISIRILSSGKIEPEGVIGMHLEKEERFIDLRNTLHIKPLESYPN